jgi:hypothetical protein
VVSPLLLANWRKINRGFCLALWAAALALALVVMGHLGSPSSSALHRPVPSGFAPAASRSMFHPVAR